MNLSSARNVHCVGIGGIGMSALAYFFMRNGAKVTGSDLVRSTVTYDLKQKGVVIKIGRHKAKNLPKDTDLVIYTAAAKRDNPEILKAKRRKILALSYPEALGKITEEKNTIAITGAHGKSTTTTLAGLLLVRAGFDPSVVVGTKVREFGNTTFRLGRSPWLVIEADEWQAGYLGFWPHLPKILIITNIDREHLDVFKNLASIKKIFRKFAERVPKDGVIIVNGDNLNSREALKNLKRRIIYFSLKDKVTKKIRKIIKVPGEHNIANAMTVWKLGKFLKIPEKTILKTIAGFHGTWRRFEYKGRLNGAILIEDYAHHPQEITTTLRSAREKYKGRFEKGGRLWCIFQPHQYQRVKYLFYEFTKAFDEADYLILLDIFRVLGGREKQKIIKEVNSQLLASCITRRGRVITRWEKHMQNAGKLLTLVLKPNDVCLVMGAGNVGEILEYLKLD